MHNSCYYVFDLLCVIKLSKNVFHTTYFFQDFDSQPEYFGCPIPCEQTRYTSKISYFHNNSWIGIDSNGKKDKIYNNFILMVSYNSLIVEERIETYLYDIETLFTSAGGNLGLFLGFSCLSAFVFIMKILFRYCIRLCNKWKNNCRGWTFPAIPKAKYLFRTSANAKQKRSLLINLDKAS